MAYLNPIYVSPFLGIYIIYAFWPIVKNNRLFKKSSWSTKDYEEQMKQYNWKPKDKWFK